MGTWTKTSDIQQLPKDFEPLYPKSNSSVFVTHTYRVGDSILKKYSDVEGEVQDKDMAIVNVFYNCEIKDDKLTVLNANVDYDVNYLQPDKLYCFTINNGSKIGIKYRDDEKVIDNYVFSE